MLNDLLDTSRTQLSGVKAERIDLVAFLDRVVARLEPQVRSRISIIKLPDVVTVCVNPHLVERVVVNLLENAAKYSCAEEPIFIEAEHDEEQAIVRVRDRGIGIPESERELVFDPSYRAQNGREREGIGLGLYLCRQLVERHGGKLWPEPNMDVGTTFAFSLPLADKR